MLKCVKGSGRETKGTIRERIVIQQVLSCLEAFKDGTADDPRRYRSSDITVYEELVS